METHCRPLTDGDRIVGKQHAMPLQPVDIDAVVSCSCRGGHPDPFLARLGVGYEWREKPLVHRERHRLAPFEHVDESGKGAV